MLIDTTYRGHHLVFEEFIGWQAYNKYGVWVCKHDTVKECKIEIDNLYNKWSK